MIELYTNNNQDTNKNGIILNPISCTITNKLNESNELEMDLPIDKYGIYKKVIRGSLIKAPTPDFNENQLYRVYDTKKCMSSNSVIVYARHILFDLNKKVIFNKNVQGHGQEVLDKILEDTKFIGISESNITDIRQYKMRNITNVLNGSEEDSFINIWGGEIECNNYNLNIPLKRGSHKGIRVTFGYNLEDIEEEITADEVITRIFPYSGDLVLSGNKPYVDSPLIAKYPEVYEQAIEMNDIKVKERTYDSEGNETTSEDAEGFNTEEEARAEMIKRCKKLYEEGADKVKANYVVKMKDLSKTQEYKKLGYDVLEKIALGDIVHCYNKNIDVEVDARCIGYTFDCINEEYEEIELGQFISGYFDNALTDLDNLYRKIIMEKQYILLRVDSLDNTMHSEIKITEDKIHSEVVNTKEELSSEITQTATEIKAEVKNTKDGLQSQITQNADKIESTVTRVGKAESKIKQNAEEISLKVSSGEEFSSEMKQNVDAFQFLFEEASGNKTEIDRNGITVYKGGFKIKNNNGDTIMWVDSNGVLRANFIGVDDINIYNTKKGKSTFYNCLANMEEIYTDKFSCDRLFVDGKHIYDYIVQVLKDKELL
ncbi:phage tail spike protein [Clostridium butyricum]|uniref:phage tail spike protein n=1 Tax=Clostridium butyricum TaxID=1492 RepID=UPI002AB1AF12|nr:phage tail spike protein [Clostridium butyricum]